MFCHEILRAGTWTGKAVDRVTLDYDARFLRRKRLETASGLGVNVDLPEMASLEDGDALRLMDGRLVLVRAAEELVAIVTGNLPRLAWHIGNRHTPCEVTADHLVIRRDPVLETMLLGLGANLRFAVAPFRPEGGAYGIGRTMGHDHAHSHAAH